MNRLGLCVVNVLVLSLVLATAAWGQSSTGRMSLAERMAALRRGWSGEDSSAQQKKEVLPTPQTRDGRQAPGWLNAGGNNGNKQATQSSGRYQRTQQQPSADRGDRYAEGGSGSSNSSRSAERPAQPMATQSLDHFSLPGLGGSRLPQAEGGAATNGVAGRSASTSTSSEDPNYPVIRDASPQEEAAGSSSTARATEPRQLPARRPAPQIDPQVLRREFSSPFSTRTNQSPTTANTAELDNRAGDASASNTRNLPPTSDVPAEVALEAVPSDARRSAKESPSSAAAEAFAAPSDRPSGLGASDFIRTPRSSALPDLPSAARSKEAFGEALQVAGGGDPNVLVSNQTPVLVSDIRGPKQILIGREAVYQVRLQNQGIAAAERVVATIRIPASAEIIDTAVTSGAVQPAHHNGSPVGLEWQLPNLKGRDSEVLDIRLIPRDSSPLELGITWTQAPVGSRAVVEVQEPQLNIEIGGPNEVLFDQPQVYRLTLSNPGTGPAENVQINLVPPGGSEETATSHQFGTLGPGESKAVEIELTAREAGKLKMQAIASAEGGLTADSSKDIFCRKAELEVDWRGPATKYANTPATYFFRVRNPGTAPAEDVTVQVALPEGAEFTDASTGQHFDADRNTVAWRVGTLNPGDDQYMELKCVVNAAGVNRFKITAATAAGNLADETIAETEVDALADLKLYVSDPSGPVAVGTQAVYEIRVQNRGADTARNVSVVGLFSEGIEPEQADGAMATVVDGRVAFQPIEEIPAGGDVTLRIRARALKEGMHIFRAEVLCTELDIKLAAEETTRFYSEELLHDGEQEPAGQSAARGGFGAAH